MSHRPPIELFRKILKSLSCIIRPSNKIFSRKTVVRLKKKNEINHSIKQKSEPQKVISTNSKMNIKNNFRNFSWIDQEKAAIYLIYLESLNQPNLEFSPFGSNYKRIYQMWLSFRLWLVRTKVIIRANYCFTYMAAQKQGAQFSSHQWFCGIYFITMPTKLSKKEIAYAIKTRV